MVESIREALNIKNKNFPRYELYTARYINNVNFLMITFLAKTNEKMFYK